MLLFQCYIIVRIIIEIDSCICPCICRSCTCQFEYKCQICSVCSFRQWFYKDIARCLILVKSLACEILLQSAFHGRTCTVFVGRCRIIHCNIRCDHLPFLPDRYQFGCCIAVGCRCCHYNTSRFYCCQKSLFSDCCFISLSSGLGIINLPCHCAVLVCTVLFSVPFQICSILDRIIYFNIFFVTSCCQLYSFRQITKFTCVDCECNCIGRELTSSNNHISCYIGCSCSNCSYDTCTGNFYYFFIVRFVVHRSVRCCCGICVYLHCIIGYCNIRSTHIAD